MDKSPKTTPEKKAKGKSKQIVDPSTFYKPKKVKAWTTCFVDEEELQARGTCIFRGEFATPIERKVELVEMPREMQLLGTVDKYKEVFRRVGLDGYFSLKPCGVDIQRAYELMTTIDKIGIVTLTRKDG